MRKKVKYKILSKNMNTKEKPPDIDLSKYSQFYKSIKLPIKYVLKNPDINLPVINNAIVMCNKIVIHTYMFMKLYLLHYYNNNNNTLPIINKDFINACMKTVCIKNETGKPPNDTTQFLKNNLNEFYNIHYLLNIENEILSYTHLNTVLDYLSVDILTMYENNIKQHYVEYIERYVNVIWKKKLITDKIRKIYKTKKERDDKIRSLNNELRKIKNDLLNVDDNNFKSKSFYHQWIIQQKNLILPIKNKFEEKSIYYDIQCTPFDYFPCMIFMMKYIEEYEEENIFIYNVFPMRNDIIPKSIKIDTTTLVHLLITEKYGNKTFYTEKGMLKKLENDIWNFFFRTERKCFYHNNYTFHHMIYTDGISCSIIMLRNDKVGKKIFNQKTKHIKEKYIDELDNYEELINKKIVSIDPGVCDLLYCVDSDKKEANYFRYSQNQRRKETKSKKYSKIILEFKKEKINNRTITEYETELSNFNRKTLDFENFKVYIQHKSNINNILYPFYEKYIFRKLKLNGYINRKKTEQKLIKNFKNKFGDEKNTIIAIGDFEQKQHMKYKEPTKGKGFRTLLRKNGYKVYLVNEFRTSCKCSSCNGGDCIKFMKMKNPKPYKDNLVLVHGLLKCQSCNTMWNRDVNGASNIYKIAYNAIHKKERPYYLCRNINILKT